MILILSLTPLLASVLLCVSALAQITLWKNKAEYTCYTTHLENQDQIRIGYKSLRKMNLGAQKLRHQKYWTTARMLAASAAYNFPLVAQLKLKLDKIIMRQIKYGKKQNLLEQKVRNMIRLMNFTTNNNLKLKLGLNPSITTQKYKFTLVKSPKASTTPDYKIPQKFSDRQKVTSKWSIPLKKILPTWMNFTNFNFNFYTQIKGSCSVTQYKKEGKWYAGLSKDKLSLNY